jgi:hypothetical protein
MINKIFGIGLSKTGTSSLSEALNQLGIKSIHYPNDEVTYHELKNGNFNLSILEKYQAVADTPVVPYYPQLDKLFQGSKFILTIRDMDTWLVSVEKHWTTAPAFEDHPLKRKFQDFIRTAVYGIVEFNKERFQYVYERHYKNVIEYFQSRPGDLLIMDICNGEGYEKLCPFLELPTLNEPFPHANEWMHKLIKATAEMKSILPGNASAILIDDQAFGVEFESARKFIPFPESNGIYQGSPQDSSSAITSFQKTISSHHPEYVVMGWPSFWWLDVYPEFDEYMRHQCEQVLANDELLVFRINNL